MNLSSSFTFKSLLLATLVAFGASNNIRGKQTEDSKVLAAQENRNLVGNDMSLDLGEMVCEEYPSSDGSVICTFRTMPPADLNTGRLLHDCMVSSRTSSMGNFCLSAEVYRVPFNEVPPSSQVINVVPQKPQTSPPKPVVVNPNPVGSVGTCPAQQQLTGMGCSQYIPMGQTSTVCLYGQLRCECSLQGNNPSIAVGWKCFVPQQSMPPPVVLPAPNPVVVPNPRPPQPPPASFSNFQCRPVGAGCSAPHIIPSDCSGTPACCPGNIIEDWRTQRNTCKHGSSGGSPITNIDANINAVSAPTPSPVRSSTGQILPNIVNHEDCPPSKPDDGDSCVWGQRCIYYKYDGNNNKVGAHDCGCAGDCEFICRPTTNPYILSF